ncbi:MAG: 2-phospho-L-lactate guanylyltransferase [Rhodospirillales bacterium]
MTGAVALVPVQALDQGRGRLEPLIKGAEQAALARAMLIDVVRALGDVQGLAGIRVLTGDPEASDCATWEGVGVMAARAGEKLNVTLARGCLNLASEGVETVVIVPADLPALDPAQVADLLARHRRDIADGAKRATLVADHRGQGTNLIIASPAAGLPFRFGPASFSEHRKAARRARFTVDVAILPSVGLDLDRPGDIARFLDEGHCGEAANLLALLDMPARIRALKQRSEEQSGH